VAGDAPVAGSRHLTKRCPKTCDEGVAFTPWRRGDAATIFHLNCIVPAQVADGVPPSAAASRQIRGLMEVKELL